MKDTTAIQHLALEIRAIINRHVDEYELVCAEVVGVLEVIKQSIFAEVKKEVDEDENSCDQND